MRELQPDAVMFSDGGPDIRWIGNERGYAGETNWSTMNRDDFYPGIPNKNKELNEGQEGGTHWLPVKLMYPFVPVGFTMQTKMTK